MNARFFSGRTFFAFLRTALAISGFTWAGITFAQTPACKPYQTTVSSGGYGTWGYSAMDVCQKLSLDTPSGAWWRSTSPSSTGEYKTATVIGLTPVGNGDWYCRVKFFQHEVDSSGNPHDNEWVSDLEAATGPHCTHCPPDRKWVDEAQACVPIIPRRQDKPPCRPCGGNPIYPLTASKRQQEFLGQWLGADGYAVFDSRQKVIAPSAGEVPWKAAPSFGGLWESSIHKKLVVQTADDQSVKGIQASRGAHVWVSFGKPGLGLVADADVMDRVAGFAGGWRYTDANAMALEDYDANGTLGKVSYRDGRFLVYKYSDVNTPVEVAPLQGLLIQLQDQTGRTVKFKYEAAEAGPRVKSITGPDGLDTQLEYNGNGNLLRVTWPDGKSRQYLYELGPIPGFVWTKIADADGPVTVTETVKVRYGKGTDWLERTVPGQGLCEPGFFGGDPAVGVTKQCDRLDVLGQPWALTGVLDENGRRHSTYGYDAQNRATFAELAGGVNRYSISYGTAPFFQPFDIYDPAARVIWRDYVWSLPAETTMTLPNGATTTYGAAAVQGYPQMTSQTQVAGSGNAGSASERTYDAAGNVASLIYYSGNRTCYVHDTARCLEIFGASEVIRQSLN